MNRRLWIAAFALPVLAISTGAARGTLSYEPSLLVQLQVKDLERSVRFYRDTLGFKVTERRDDLQFVHIDPGLKGLQIGLSAGSPQVVPGTIVLNFGVTGDIEEARRLLESRGVTFTSPTQVIPGKVRLASFKDPDGYRITLARDETP